MSGTFDAYHVWLGIPPSEQPPNHYRLLGIPVFETDLDVIDHAANRQMAHVRTFQTGKQGARSQALLNELSSARLCLLSPDKKSAYDEQLRAKLSSVPKAVPAGVPKAAPVAAPVAKVEPSGTSPARSQDSSSSLSQPLVAADDSELIDIPLDDEPASKPAPRRTQTAPGAPVKPAATATVKATAADGLAPQGFDEDDFAMPAATQTITVRGRRRGRRGQSTWKRPVALGIMAGVLVISFFFIYYLGRYLIRNSGDLQDFILHGPAASETAEPVETGDEAAAIAAPPSPDETE